MSLYIPLLTVDLYRKNFETRGPEARLYLPCVAGILFPISMFIYAWSSVPQIPWIALIIGVTVNLFLIFAAILPRLISNEFRSSPGRRLRYIFLFLPIFRIGEILI